MKRIQKTSTGGKKDYSTNGRQLKVSFLKIFEIQVNMFMRDLWWIFLFRGRELNELFGLTQPQ